MDCVLYEQRTTKEIDDNGTRLRVTLVAQLHDLGQGPYFSLTHETYELVGRRWREYSFGCGVEQWADHFPEVMPFAKWHLMSVKSGPMHYEANALYWAGHSGWCDGKDNSPPNETYLKSTIVYGSVAGDEDVDLMELDKEGLRQWLRNRFDPMMRAFDEDMRRLFPEYELVAK